VRDSLESKRCSWEVSWATVGCCEKGSPLDGQEGLQLTMSSSSSSIAMSFEDSAHIDSQRREIDENTNRRLLLFADCRAFGRDNRLNQKRHLSQSLRPAGGERAIHGESRSSAQHQRLLHRN